MYYVYPRWSLFRYLKEDQTVKLLLSSVCSALDLFRQVWRALSRWSVGISPRTRFPRPVTPCPRAPNSMVCTPGRRRRHCHRLWWETPTAKLSPYLRDKVRGCGQSRAPDGRTFSDNIVPGCAAAACVVISRYPGRRAKLPGCATPDSSTSVSAAPTIVLQGETFMVGRR